MKAKPATLKFDDVCSYLLRTTLTVEQLRQLSEVVNSRYDERRRMVRAEVKLGDIVFFESNKRNYPSTIVGKVHEFTPSKARIVTATGQGWSVSLSILKLVAPGSEMMKRYQDTIKKYGEPTAPRPRPRRVSKAQRLLDDLFSGAYLGPRS